MTRLPGPDEFRSVDWEGLSEKRDWSSAAWTAAAVLIILLGFFGGMVCRTSLTGGAGMAEEQVPVVQDVQNAQNTQTAENADQTPRP